MIPFTILTSHAPSSRSSFTRPRYVDIAVHLLQSGRHSKWKAELHEKKTTHLAFDTVNPIVNPHVIMKRYHTRAFFCVCY